MIAQKVSRACKRTKLVKITLPCFKSLTAADLSRKDDFHQLFNFQGPVISECTIVTTIRRCHQQSAPALLLEKLSFHEHQDGTHGRQQGDFRPFQPVSVAGRISFTNRAPFLWNMLRIPREVQTFSSMLVF